MKYIRTKDGRIIVQGEETDNGFDKGKFEIHNYAKIVETIEPFFDTDVIKQADTIEELCDTFVEAFEVFDMEKLKHHIEEAEKEVPNLSGIVLEYFSKNLVWTEKYFEWFNNSKKDFYKEQVLGREKYGVKCILYGAIWTEWGLKYVAKLNKEGEFELL